jgi:dipeptidyl aminopeptidase/acylaminoacyl peptidase
VSTAAPFGSWPSPITADAIVASSVALGGPVVAAGSAWWSELRPNEGGRVQIVRRALTLAGAGGDGESDLAAAVDVLPDGFSARTRVHEYGGGAWWLDAHTGVLFFTNWSDQRIYRLDPDGPVPITPAPDQPHGYRYADGVVSPDGTQVICVREWHGAPGATEARNEIVVLPTDGRTEPRVLVGGPDGPDFVASPRLSPPGRRLCWLQWNHPDMPWDHTELWIGDIQTDGGDGEDLDGNRDRVALENARAVAGEPGESIIEPRWQPDGSLHFLSDRNEWWSLYRLDESAGTAVALIDATVEIGKPPWVFGGSSYCFTGARDIVCVCRADGQDFLGRLEVGAVGATTIERVDGPFTAIESVVAAADGVVLIGASFTDEPRVLGLPGPRGAAPVVLRPPRDLRLDPGWFSVPEHVTFATSDRAVAHALFYPPRNADHHGPTGQAPPLLVMSHGGPTSAARPQLNLSVQYWTSRGFAVVDVNYRGSVGYGRTFRHSLRGRWGIADVDDCIAAARHLGADGRVDGTRLVIRGGSAGGYTTLCALTFHDDFTAGCSLYGVADLEALARDTHKFESRYLDRLVGPYPEDQATYRERSPIHHTDRLSTPLIILQGRDDAIVPLEQAEMMAEALRERGVTFAYLVFDGEEHGFRQAANIRRALEAELYFYSKVLGFELADPIEPVTIEHL